MDNLETLATYGTQDEVAIKNGQSRDTGHIKNTRNRTKTTKTKHNTTQKTKKMSNNSGPN